MRILTGELRISPNYSRKYSPGGKRNLLLSKGCFLVVVESSARRPPSRGRRTGPSPTSRDTTPTSRDDRTQTTRDERTLTTRDDRTSRASSRFHPRSGFSLFVEEFGIIIDDKFEGLNDQSGGDSLISDITEDK